MSIRAVRYPITSSVAAISHMSRGVLSAAHATVLLITARVKQPGLGARVGGFSTSCCVNAAEFDGPRIEVSRLKPAASLDQLVPHGHPRRFHLSSRAT